MPEHRTSEHVEDVAVVVRVVQPDALVADTRERLRSEDDDGVDREKKHGRDHGCSARSLRRILGLLVHGDCGVPAPIDEDHQDQAGDEGGDAGNVERVEPAPRRIDMRRPSVTGRNLDQRHDGEDHEHAGLDGEQPLLHVGRDLDAAVADVGHDREPGEADQQHPAARRVATDAVRAEEQEDVLPGDLRQARHDQDVGGDDAPAARVPAHPWSEHPRGPGERRAAVGIRLVQLAVADRDHPHRDEREDRDDRGLDADEEDDEAERRRQAVGRARSTRRRRRQSTTVRGCRPSVPSACPTESPEPWLSSMPLPMC